MKTSISNPVKFKRLLVPENKEYKLGFKEKRLVDNSLENLHEKSAITPDICSLPCLYGLPKIHKAFVYPLPNYREIISQNGFGTCAIAKHLLDCISSITKNEYTLKN